MSFQTEDAISANVSEDGSLSIYQVQNIIFMKQDPAKEFLAWLNEALK